MRVEDFGKGPAQVVFAGGQAEDTARLVVDEHERTATVDGQHAVAHVGDEMAEEGIVDEMGRRDGRPMDGPRAGGEHRGLGGATSGGDFWGRHGSAVPATYATVVPVTTMTSPAGGTVSNRAVVYVCCHRRDGFAIENFETVIQGRSHVTKYGHHRR